MKLISAIGLILLLHGHSYGQDTLRLERKPEVILKSWYPEFKEFPYLKVGDTKILFTIIPDFEKLSIRENDINLEVDDSLVKIKETEKTNQYLITVDETNSAYVEFEIWFDIGTLTILLKENNQWMDIRKIYPFKENRVMLQKIKLKIKN
jgi:NDP-sugar pyrophosphorylase family protein